jgi:hypothetical protein
MYMFNRFVRPLIGPLWVIALAALALYGLVTTVNAVAFLVGVGPESTVHIETVRIEQVTRTDSQGHSTQVDTKIGVGYYTENGQRHPVEIDGFRGQPGDVVLLRRPLLAEGLVLTPYRWDQAVSMLLAGLLGLAPAFWLVYAISRRNQ